MFRRTFLSALGAVPLLGFLKPQEASWGRPTWFFLDEASTWPERNTGHTHRALKRAIEAAHEYKTVVFLTHSYDEALRAVSDVEKILGPDARKRPSAGRRWFSIRPGGSLVIGSVQLRQYLGLRAHFILDHSVRERLSVDEQRLLAETLNYAEIGTGFEVT
jgi:hypothetical protein